MASLIAPLFDGPLDVIGDIHGELDALTDLLAALGYDRRGAHPAGRRLVFVGDLGDRGPDSPGVFALVRDLVQRERAQCVLGNHELNLLRDDAKHGNRWFLDPDHPEQRGEFVASLPAPADLKPAWLDFMHTLPLALERPDLRVTHAAWHAPAIEAVRHAPGPTRAVFDQHERATLADLDLRGINAAAMDELRAHRLDDRSTRVPLLPNVALRDELQQLGNPIRVLTSGLERVATTPFWANGKWRMVDRVRWWNDYHDDVAVIVGHYWRIADPALSGDKPDLFDGAPLSAWQGPRRNVFCVDFSIGGRYVERAKRVDRFTTHLGAVRWPERELVFEDGTRTSLL